MRQYRSVIKTNKFPQLTRRVFTTADGLKSDNITAMRFDNNGVLFVGTDKGLARFDGEKFSPVSIGRSHLNDLFQCRKSYVCRRRQRNA